MNYNMYPSQSGECQCLWKLYSESLVDAIEQKATQTFKCRALPLANDFGDRCETGKSLNFLSGPSSGAAEVSSLQERRVDLYSSIFNFPV